MRRGSHALSCLAGFVVCACSSCWIGLWGLDRPFAVPRVHRSTKHAPRPIHARFAVAGSAEVVEALAERPSEEEGRVFVSVAAFCDPELSATLRSMLTQARRPELLFVGLVWQSFEDEDPLSREELADLSALWGVKDGDAKVYENPVLTEIFEGGKLPLPASPKYSCAELAGGHIRLLKIRAQDARGPCWARYLAQHMWAGEDFYMQVDSHMRFVPQWDDEMRAQLAWCGRQSEKPVLSTYGRNYPLGSPPDWDPPETYKTPGLICAGFFDSNGVLNIQSRPLKDKLENPRRNPFWSGHFSFSSSKVLKEVPYDPQCLMLLFGEEPLMAARLFTHGWDVYTPSEGLLFHLWDRDYRRTFFEMKQIYDELLPRTLRRVFWLLGSGPEPPASEQQRGWPHPGRTAAEVESSDTFGLGTSRSLEEYERMADLSYHYRRIGDLALSAGFPDFDQFLVPEAAPPPPPDGAASVIFFVVCAPVVLGALQFAWSGVQSTLPQ